jgi:hypothetical protein
VCSVILSVVKQHIKWSLSPILLLFNHRHSQNKRGSVASLKYVCLLSQCILSLAMQNICRKLPWQPDLFQLPTIVKCVLLPVKCCSWDIETRHVETPVFPLTYCYGVSADTLGGGHQSSCRLRYVDRTALVRSAIPPCLQSKVASRWRKRHVIGMSAVYVYVLKFFFYDFRPGNGLQCALTASFQTAPYCYISFRVQTAVRLASLSL